MRKKRNGGIVTPEMGCLTYWKIFLTKLGPKNWSKRKLFLIPFCSFTEIWRLKLLFCHKLSISPECIVWLRRWIRTFIMYTYFPTILQMLDFLIGCILITGVWGRPVSKKLFYCANWRNFWWLPMLPQVHERGAKFWKYYALLQFDPSSIIVRLSDTVCLTFFLGSGWG